MSEVIKIENSVDLSVSLTTTLSDETTSTGEFKVNSGVQKLVYLGKGKDETISGTVTGLKYELDEFGAVNPIALQITENKSGKVVEVPLGLVKLCGEPEKEVESGSTITDVIANVEEGQVISMPAESFTSEKLELSKSVSIKGAQSNVSAVSEERRNDSVEGETVIDSPVVVANDASVDLIGVAVTSKGTAINLSKAEEVSMRNVKVVNIVPTAKKTMAVLGNKDEKSVKLEIKDCYFGNAAKNEEHPEYGLYNYFELTKPLTDGSVIENCYFAAEVCNHNAINIYAVEDNATITIKDCVFEKSVNAIRIGIIGDKRCTINIENCTYLATDEEYPEYAGLLLIQPYGKQTTDMSHITINIKNINNKTNAKQLWYKYAGSGDMQFDEYNVPTVIVDGRVELAPKKK